MSAERRAKLRKLFATIGLSTTFFAQGLVYAVRGPALLDLAEFAGSDSLANVSLIFPATAVGLILGSVSCQFVFEGVPRFKVASFTLALLLCSLSAMGVALFPGSVILICVVFMLQGFTLGPLRDGGSLMALAMGADGAAEGKEDRVLNICGVFYFSGAFAAPMIARRYQTPDEKALDHTFYFVNRTLEEERLSELSGMDELYLVIGGVVACVFVVFAATHLVCGRPVKGAGDDAEEGERQEQGVDEVDEQQSQHSLNTTHRQSMTPAPLAISKATRVSIYALMCVYLFVLSGVQVSFGTFATPYGVYSQLNLSKSEATKTAAVFYFSQLFGHILMTIFTSGGMKSTYLMTFGLSCHGAASLLLLFTGGAHRQSLGIAACLLGIGSSDLLLHCLRWLRRWPGLALFAAAAAVASHLGAELGAFVVGQSLQDRPEALLWTVVLGTTLAVAVAMVIAFLASRGRQDGAVVKDGSVSEGGTSESAVHEYQQVPREETTTRELAEGNGGIETSN